MAAARAGLHQLLPSTLRLLSGPGCPVCVTPVSYLDHALGLAEQSAISLTTFGDLMRVPGSQLGGPDAPPRTLAAARAAGADVRVVLSPLDALRLARCHPDRQVVFLGIGFETTAPALAAAILQAAAERLDNFTMLVAPKTLPEALALLVGSDELSLDGLLCPGHVSVILGEEVYRSLVQRHGVPCAITGFEPVEMLRGLVALLDQIATAEPRVDNCYPGAVRPAGNRKARRIMDRVFEPIDSNWRGLGIIPRSGLAIREAYGTYDAARRFSVSLPEPVEPAGCHCGEVLRGVLDPVDCPLFGNPCTPDHPSGACMVSSEGSCAARFLYRSAP